jgi:cation diffusion facilitator CzcD-associated flavoprotein CzcO
MLDTAIIGAGPYGLSVAAYLRHRGIQFRIFGRPMDSWRAHMPKGMMLKSDGFASNIYDPKDAFTLEKFCGERGIEYAHSGIPVQLETFTAYGLAFRDRMVPELEDKLIVGVDRTDHGFVLQIDDGESIRARNVILAVGITHFEYVPESLSKIPVELLSHSSYHHDLERFRNHRVVVIGGGSSALDLAGLLHEVGADVELVSRREELNFHSKPAAKSRSWWKKLRHPSSGLGPSMRSRFYSDFPNLFHYLPDQLRVGIVRKALGPSGGWFIRDKVIGKVPLLLGFTPESSEVQSGKVRLKLRGKDGSKRELIADHVIAATGYRVDVERLQFLTSIIRSQIKLISSSPALSSQFECSIPGLYFVGVSAANSFGPVMRFAFGAEYAAKTVTRAVESVLTRKSNASSVKGASPEKQVEMTD